MLLFNVSVGTSYITVSKSAFWGKTTLSVTAREKKQPFKVRQIQTVHLLTLHWLNLGEYSMSTSVSRASSVGDFPQQHALKLPDPALLRQSQPLFSTLLFFQQLLDVAGGAQQDVARGLHGEDGPSKSLPAGHRARAEWGGERAEIVPSLVWEQKCTALAQRDTYTRANSTCWYSANWYSCSE